MSRVGVVVLAAGRSTRFVPGAHKLLALVGGVPVIRLAASAAVAADVGDVYVITGAQGPAVVRALDGLRVRIVHEPAFADGMAISLRRGISVVRVWADAVIVGLGDEPDVRPEAYRRIAAQWETSNRGVVVPRYAGATGPSHPILFGAELFDELLALEGDVGARSVIARDPSRVVEAELEWPAPRDVDTVEDLDVISRELETAQGSTDDRAVNPHPPGDDSR